MADNSEIIKNLGPLAPLAGIWEGDKGDDIAPSDDRRGIENNKYRERIVFEPLSVVNNHEQTLYGLKHSKTAWRIGEANAFHEETGYWLWDANAKQVLHCFIVPRGITVLSGGTANSADKKFKLSAELGSPTYGICSNKFLDEEFKTVRFDITVTIHNDTSFSYEADTLLKMKGRAEPFHHTDKNTLKKL